MLKDNMSRSIVGKCRSNVTDTSNVYMGLTSDQVFFSLGFRALCKKKIGRFYTRDA